MGAEPSTHPSHRRRNLHILGTRLAAIVEPLLTVHVILREQIAKLLNDVNPQAWLADALARIADPSQSRLSELLPWNWKAQSARLAA